MFEKRTERNELIDRPDCRLGTIEQSHRFMRFVNRFLGGTSAVRNFIEYARAKNQSGRPLYILDIGSGSCDIPLRIIQWAEDKNVKIDITCVEKEDAAMKLRKKIPALSELPITFVNDDIFHYRPGRWFDYAVASMFLHHLDYEQISNLTRRLRTYTRKGIFINDLHRSALTYISCVAISPFISKEVRHDALISIRKGFKKNELRTSLGLPGCSVAVSTRLWGRITALLEFEGGNKIEDGNQLTCDC
jgi:SAM-dependent methyltransferase